MELMMAKEHLYTLIKVATEEDIRAQIGTTTLFDLVNYDSIKVHRVKKQTPFQDFKAQIAEELGIPVVLQRYWVWAKRINKTTRPNRPLTAVEEAQTVQQLKDSHMKMPLTELRLFLEAPILREDLKQLSPSLPERNRGDILIFFKLYDPEKETLQYVGSLYVRLSYRPNEVMRHINRLAGFPEDQPIKLFEEIKFDPNVMCEAIDKKLTLKGSQLEDGDIICFQKELPLGAESAHRFPEVPAFMENVVNRQVVHFRKLEKPSAPYFDLELSKELTYLDAISALAAHMGLDNPAKLRLSPHNVHTHMPRVAPFKYATSDKLYDMLRGNTPYSDILYYEVLDIPLPDLEKLKTLNVVFANSKVEEVASHQIRIPRTGTVSDLLVELRKKVELSRPDAELRVVEVITSKISKVLPPGDKISDQCWKIRAEEVPTEEVDAGPNDRLLHVYHFRRDKLNKDQAILFGNPFLLVVREGETMAEVKARIKAKLGTKDGEFDTWKFAHVTNKASPEYIKDDEVVLTRFPSAVSIFEAEFLGMEHADMGPQRARIREPERRGHETDTDPDPESKPNHEPDVEAGLKPDHKLGSDSDGGSAGKPWLTANPGIVNGAWLDELRVFWESNSGLQSVPVIPDEKSRELLQRFLSDKVRLLEAEQRMKGSSEASAYFTEMHKLLGDLFTGAQALGSGNVRSTGGTFVTLMSTLARGAIGGLPMVGGLAAGAVKAGTDAYQEFGMRRAAEKVCRIAPAGLAHWVAHAAALGLALGREGVVQVLWTGGGNSHVSIAAKVRLRWSNLTGLPEPIARLRGLVKDDLERILNGILSGRVTGVQGDTDGVEVCQRLIDVGLEATGSVACTPTTAGPRLPLVTSVPKFAGAIDPSITQAMQGQIDNLQRQLARVPRLEAELARVPRLEAELAKVPRLEAEVEKLRRRLRSPDLRADPHGRGDGSTTQLLLVAGAEGAVETAGQITSVQEQVDVLQAAVVELKAELEARGERALGAETGRTSEAPRWFDKRRLPAP